MPKNSPETQFAKQQPQLHTLCELRLWTASTKQLLRRWLMWMFIYFCRCFSNIGQTKFLKTLLFNDVLQAPKYPASLRLLPWPISCVSHPWVRTQGWTVRRAAALWKFSRGQECYSKFDNYLSIYIFSFWVVIKVHVGLGYHSLSLTCQH